MITGIAKCGMRYAVKKSGNAVAYCALSTRCGTRDEAGFHSGIAHFTEHTIFKGTSHKSATTINRYLDKLGGELNAYTTKEELVLHATVLKEDLKKAESLLMELATCPKFPQKAIDTEKGVVIDEIQSYKDSPADDVYDKFEEKLFAGHPLSNPILGTSRTVSKINTEELKQFNSEKFRPEVMAFTVVADKDEKHLEKEVLQLIEKYFPAEEQIQPLTGHRPETDEHYFTPPLNHFDEEVEKRNHEVNAVIGGLAPSLYEEKERLTTILMSNILAGPVANSILNEILREKNGWVYNVESSYTQYSDTGILAICLGCDRSNLSKCLTAVKKEILKLQTIPLTETKLKAAKKQLFGQIAISSDNLESQCLSMGKSLLSYGEVMSDEEMKEKINSITPEDIRDITCRIFSPENTSRLIFL